MAPACGLVGEDLEENTFQVFFPYRKKTVIQTGFMVY